MTVSRQPLDAGWQRLFRHYLRHTCTLSSPQSMMPNEYGELPPATPVSGVACFAQGSTQRVFDQQKIGERPQWNIDFPHDQDVKVDDLIEDVTDVDGNVLVKRARVSSMAPITSERHGILLRPTVCEER